jgi:hypothetical protein
MSIIDKFETHPLKWCCLSLGVMDSLGSFGEKGKCMPSKKNHFINHYQIYFGIIHASDVSSFKIILSVQGGLLSGYSQNVSPSVYLMT